MLSSRTASFERRSNRGGSPSTRLRADVRECVTPSKLIGDDQLHADANQSQRHPPCTLLILAIEIIPGCCPRDAFTSPIIGYRQKAGQHCFGNSMINCCSSVSLRSSPRTRNGSNRALGVTHAGHPILQTRIGTEHPCPCLTLALASESVALARIDLICINTPLPRKHG